jgi:hypothetical protein
MVDNVTNSNNKYTPMVNFNPFNTQQTEKQGCSKYSRTGTCGHLYYLKVTFFFPVIEKFMISTKLARNVHLMVLY